MPQQCKIPKSMARGLVILAVAGLCALLTEIVPAQAPTTGGARGGTSGTLARGAAGAARRGMMGTAKKGPVVTVHSPRDDGAWTTSSFSAIKPGLPTLFIAGDSTAQKGDPAHRGWGALLIDYYDSSKLNIVNCAIGGRSFRTFTSEGRWDKLAAQLKPGDYVVIELGHNDGGGAQSANGRGDVPGIGEETAVATKRDGTTETVHTYGWYLRKYINEAKAKGATPIVASTTVRNIWRNGKAERGLGKFYDWAKQVAEQEHALFLDHSNIIADAYEKMGQDAVARFFPVDPVHTSTDGAVKNAEMLIAGLKGLKVTGLVDPLSEKGKAIEAYQPAAK